MIISDNKCSYRSLDGIVDGLVNILHTLLLWARKLALTFLALVNQSDLPDGQHPTNTFRYHLWDIVLWLHPSITKCLCGIHLLFQVPHHLVHPITDMTVHLLIGYWILALLCVKDCRRQLCLIGLLHLLLHTQPRRFLQNEPRVFLHTVVTVFMVLRTTLLSRGHVGSVVLMLRVRRWDGARMESLTVT